MLVRKPRSDALSPISATSCGDHRVRRPVHVRQKAARRERGEDDESQTAAAWGGRGCGKASWVMTIHSGTRRSVDTPPLDRARECRRKTRSDAPPSPL